MNSLNLPLALFTCMTILTPAMAKAEASYQFQCHSKELGLVQISLSNPQRRTLGCVYFDTHVQRFDSAHRLVDSWQNEPAKSNRGFDARICDGDSSAMISFPPTPVNWASHRNECWVTSEFAGATLELNIKTGVVAPLMGDTATYSTQDLNPNAEMRSIDNGFFNIAHPFVDGQQCADTSDSLTPNVVPDCALMR